MKSYSLTTILSLSLILGTPSISLAHVGHGDEFQATGGIDKVEVKPETDQLLGIVVTPIDQASTDGVGVMIPVSALVEADGKQLVFVQYENFYEPVEVTTGVTEGELIQVTEKLSVGEKLVTQGSLSLYAESRKTQNTENTETNESSTENSTIEDTTTTDSTIDDSTTHAQADKEGIPHSHDKNGNLVEAKGLPISKTLIAVGGLGILALIGLFAIPALKGNKNKKSTNSQYTYNPED